MLENVSGILYAFAYLALFAIPLVGRSWRAPLGLKIVSASGFAVTALYCALSIFPIIEVESASTFTLEIVVALAIAELIGIGLYIRGRSQARQAKSG